MEARLAPEHSPRPSLAVAVAALALALAPAAHATAGKLYDTSRVLAHTGNECAAQKATDCITVASPRLAVAKGGTRLITLSCTARFPHLVGWDTTQHEHLRLVLTAGDPAAGATAGTTKPDRLGVVALNSGDARGYAKLFAGCSRKPWAGTPFMSTREGLPTKSAAFTGARP